MHVYPEGWGFAPVAQLVEASDLGSEGWGFEPLLGYVIEVAIALVSVSLICTLTAIWLRRERKRK